MTIKDYFSIQAADYARYRPDYPIELYDFILAHTQGRQQAWDCGTGNGQVTSVLASYFDKVIATDISKNQLEAAVPHKNITYKIASADDSGLADNSVDLITVGQALHWFDFDLFYKEAKRVACPNALLAAFSYGNPTVDNEQVDILLKHFYDTVVGPYWPKERQYIDEGYATIPFPFNKLEAPEMTLIKQWDLHAFVGYLNTWSATQQYIKAHGKNPIEQIESDLVKAWGKPTQSYTITWPLYLLAAEVGWG